MAQMIYANPFGAAAEGAQRGLDNVLKLGQAGRQFRDSDRQAEFRKWYDPFVQKQMQQKYDADTEAMQMQRLQNLANAGRYVGNLGRFDQEIGGYYGMPPQGTRTPQQAQFAADIYSGAVPPSFANPDIVSAGGITRRAPLSPAEQELQALTNQLTRAQANYYTNLYQNPNQQNQPQTLPQYDQIDLLHGIGGVQTSPQPQYAVPGFTPPQNPNGGGQVQLSPLSQPQQSRVSGFDPYGNSQEQQDIFDQSYLNDPYGEF